MPKKSGTGVGKGYGKGSKEGQYKKGQSGNKNGRPKGSKNKKTTFREFMEAPLPTTSTGGKKVTAHEALLKTLLHKALVEKDRKSAETLLDMDSRFCPERYKYGLPDEMMKKIAELEKELEQAKLNQGGGVLVVPAGVSMDEYLIQAEKQRQVMLKDQERFSQELEAGKWDIHNEGE